MRGSGGGGRRRQNAVPPGDGPAPAAAAAQTRSNPAPAAPRTAVPAEQATPTALSARSPGAAAYFFSRHQIDQGNNSKQI